MEKRRALTPSPGWEGDQGQTHQRGLTDMSWATGENIPAARLLLSPWEETNLRVFPIFQCLKLFD